MVSAAFAKLNDDADVLPAEGFKAPNAGAEGLSFEKNDVEPEMFEKNEFEATEVVELLVCEAFPA